MELFLAFTLQLFILVDPVAGVPVFLSITPHSTPAERRVMARRGSFVAFIIVAFFLMFGSAVLGYLGITTAAIRICGGILLFVIALEMLYGRFTGTGTSRREEQLAGEKADISITPLAVPLMAGPGAITTALIFADRAANLGTHLALLGGCVLVFAVSYLFLRQADRLMRILGDLGTAILTRIMGLILAFLAVQYTVDGVRSAFA
ncbi:MAG: NAAT family transporter [Desulfuromonadales bacterium]|nr:NAAT family transporter [Desulfuromonadales bacterium]